MTVGELHLKKELNINTVIAIVGFLGTFAGLITLWNNTQYEQQDMQRWISAHDHVHSSVSSQLNVLNETDAGRDKALLDLSFRIGQLEKANENMELRLGRVTESYGNQFTEMRGALSSISTQIALTNQTLQRLEASGGNPGDRK